MLDALAAEEGHVPSLELDSGIGANRAMPRQGELKSLDRAIDFALAINQNGPMFNFFLGPYRLPLTILAFGVLLIGGIKLYYGYQIQAYEAGPIAPNYGLSIGVLPHEAVLLDRVASQIAQHPAHVHCNLPSQTIDGDELLGRAVVGSSDEQLLPSLCGDLGHHFSVSDWNCIAQAVADCGQEVDLEILAMHILAHESYHLFGTTNEAKTDCYALQTVSFVAQEFGASAVQALSLSAYYYQHYQAIRGAPPEYQTPDCHNGGPDDLRPTSNVWPG
jgi:hypothetical protein